MNFEKLENYLENLENMGVPFAGIKVVHKGKIVYEKIFGKRKNNESAGYEDLFYFYSATKVVTSVACMQLVEKGKIDLDAPVYKYIPEFKNMVVGKDRIPAKNAITVRHLLSMTSGYGYDFDAKYLKAAIEDKNASTMDVVKAMANDSLLFEPGTKYQYGFGLDIVGAVIEAVTGMTYGEYVNENIFKPLGMNSSTYKITDDVKEKLLPLYYYDGETNSFVLDKNQNRFILTNNFESGGAGLISCIDDYTKFVSVLANYGIAENGYKLLSKDSIDKMREDNLGDKVKDFYKRGYSYGLGVRTLIDKESSKSPLGEFGWDSAACAYVMADVDNNIGVFFGCHVLGFGPGYEYHMEIRDLVYECLEI